MSTVVYKVRVVHGEYEKLETVFCDENDEVALVYAKARKQFLRGFGTPLALCSESQKILSCSETED